VEYKDHVGKTKKSKLLLSGFWGLSRHMNYVFEMMLATSWSLPGLRYGYLVRTFLTPVISDSAAPPMVSV
jgi:7-dehydrocholesterol reductase